MRTSKRSPRYGTVATVFLVILAAACGSSTEPSPVFAWAGTYEAQTRFGGCLGTWGSGTQGSHLLVITSAGEVTQNGTKIIAPTVGDSTISWSISDGNGSNADITFHHGSEDACTWGFAGQLGALFDGTIQFAGEGPLDYRGLKE